MKKTLLTLLSLAGVGFLAAQQAPLYILFNSACMDQLEYRYVYAGTTVQAYSVHPTANENYILTAGNGGINAPSLPQNTVNCREYALNDQFLNDVNNFTRQVYIVQQQPQGYTLTPVISATQVLRSGSYYLFRAPNYSFAVDTANLVYESNIATGTSSWYIYFNGLKIRSCYYEYSFKREPTKANQERSEFDFVPGIGITSERTGMTAADAEANQLRLVRVNGMALEDYVASKCRTAAGATGTTGNQPLSQYTPQVNYGAMPVREGDKEMVSMQGTGTPTTTGEAANMPKPLANCPELPGTGYHIVQPGETLNAISRAYNVSLKSLVSWNKLKDPDVIQVCQKIWVQKPPANAAALVYKGEDNPATYSTTPAPQPAQTIRQDMYWQGNAAYTQPTQYTYAPPATTTQPAQPQYNYYTQQPVPPTQYNYTQPAVSYQPAQPAKTLVHTVQKGETLYGIGMRYGLPETEMRRLNNFPPSGDVILKPGMQLFVADCCPNTGAATYPANTTTQPGATYPNLAAQPQYNPAYAPTTPAQPQYTPNTQPGNTFLPDLYTAPANTQPTPATYNTYGTQPAPTTYNTYGAQPTVSQPAATTNQPPPTTTKPPAYFQEYIVREGDTINSIAIKFKVNAQELALVNNKDPKETLIAGQRLLIPRN